MAALTAAVLVLLVGLCTCCYRYRHVLRQQLRPRVRLQRVPGRPDLEGFHATVLDTPLCRAITSRADQELRGFTVRTMSETLHVSASNCTWSLALHGGQETVYSTEAVAVIKASGRGYGLFAQRAFQSGEIVLTEAVLSVFTIDEAQAALDPVMVTLNEDANTVLALAQLDLGRRPDAEEWDRLPGMKPIADRIIRRQAELAYSCLSPRQRLKWMSLHDSLALHGSTGEKSAAGVLHSNSFGGTSGGTRTSVLFELISRVNHSCAPNIELQTESAGHRATLTALRDLECGEELCIDYNPTLRDRSTEHRRAALRRKHRFHCVCTRCGPISDQAATRYDADEARCVRMDEEVVRRLEAFNAAA
jgi:hypothetical protein